MVTRRLGYFAARGRFRGIPFGIIRHFFNAQSLAPTNQRGKDAILGISKEAMICPRAAPALARIASATRIAARSHGGTAAVIVRPAA
jgi:hypothetical protein